MIEGRSAIHAYLSDEAKEAWEMLSFDNGVSLTGILEAIAKELREEINTNGHDADGLRPAWIKDARRIDAERRKRGRR